MMLTLPLAGSSQSHTHRLPALSDQCFWVFKQARRSSHLFSKTSLRFQVCTRRTMLQHSHSGHLLLTLPIKLRGELECPNMNVSSHLTQPRNVYGMRAVLADDTTLQEMYKIFKAGTEPMANVEGLTAYLVFQP